MKIKVKNVKVKVDSVVSISTQHNGRPQLEKVCSKVTDMYLVQLTTALFRIMNSLLQGEDLIQIWILNYNYNNNNTKIYFS